MNPLLKSLLLTAACAVAVPASALHILITNDDSWNTANIKALKVALMDAGHQVIMSAPCTNQSGKGGAMTFLKGTRIDTSRSASSEFCVGDVDTSMSFANFSEGTPLMASVYGIDIAAQNIWGSAPDLVISGPNEGNNLGYLNNSSGTIGAAMIAVVRGVPGIAVSSATSDAVNAKLVGQVVVDIVKQLESSRVTGRPLLPAFTGLNVNTPKDMVNHRGYKFTDIGWNGGGADIKFSKSLADDPVAANYIAQGIMAATGLDAATAAGIVKQKYTGVYGISFDTSGALVNDKNEMSEGIAVNQGYITISTMDAQIQASQVKVAVTRLKLQSLVK
jgi:5'-nucleotidase